MAVQLPGAGTPIDATLLGSYALEINRLAGTVANSTKMSTVNPPPVSQESGVKRSVITPELSFFAGWIDLSWSGGAGSRPKDITFDNVFAQTPIVVATPYSANATQDPSSISVIQTSCSTSKASFKIKYSTNFSGFLNVIAIGISTKL